MTEESDKQPKPTNLDEAHASLLRMLTPEQVEEFRVDPDAPLRHHRGLGMFIRNEWIRHGQLARVFAGINPGSIDGMSALILESFVSKLCGQPFDLLTRAAEEAVGAREYYFSIEAPDKVSPIDSAPIKWVIVRGYGQGAIHTGVSTSDGTCWRWVYGGTGIVEPATAEEAERVRSTG